MNVYIETFKQNIGYQVIKSGLINKILPEYNKLKSKGEPVSLVLDYRGAEDMPDFTDRLVQGVLRMVGLQVIGYAGELDISEQYKLNERNFYNEND